MAPLESVNDEFNGGRKSRCAIKRFLRLRAGALEHALRRLLVGDGSADRRGICSARGTDWVPVALIPGPVSAGTLGLEMVPADPWYGGAWTRTAGCWYSTLIEPDLYVGRLPVNSLAAGATDVVAKLVAYESLRRRRDLAAAHAAARRRLLLGREHLRRRRRPTAYCYRCYEIVFRLLNQAVRGGDRRLGGPGAWRGPACWTCART